MCRSPGQGGTGWLPCLQHLSLAPWEPVSWPAGPFALGAPALACFASVLQGLAFRLHYCFCFAAYGALRGGLGLRPSLTCPHLATIELQPLLSGCQCRGLHTQSEAVAWVVHRIAVTLPCKKRPESTGVLGEGA